MEQETEIVQRLTRIETKLDTHIVRVDDHEKRLRFLERYAFILVGVFALIILVVKTFTGGN